MSAQAMGSIWVEHAAIRVVVSALRETGKADGRPIFLAWSPREVLELKPEYAWLKCAENSFIRLPLDAPDLLAAIRAPRTAVERGSELERLLTPLGQWRWATRQLTDEIAGGHTDKAQLRLANLEPFVKRHWPGWFDADLSRLRRLIRSPATRITADGIAEHLANEGDAVAAVVACEPLTRWSGSTDNARKLAQCQDAICYAAQGLSPTHGSSTDWLMSLQGDLVSAQGNIQEVIRGGGTLPEVIRAALAVLSETLAGTVGEPSLEAVDRVSLAIGRLAHIEAQTHWRLMESRLR